MEKLAELIDSYISKWDEIIKRNDRKEAEGHQDIIISTLGNYIKGLTDGLDNYSGLGFYTGIPVDFIGDMKKLKCKLEVYKIAECNTISRKIDSPSNGNVYITNNNSNINNNTNNNQIDISMLFEKAYENISNNESLGENEIEEALKRIKEIEEISKLEESKNKKWSKLKPVMAWVGTKGVVVATEILSLINANISV